MPINQSHYRLGEGTVLFMCRRSTAGDALACEASDWRQFALAGRGTLHARRLRFCQRLTAAEAGETEQVAATSRERNSKIAQDQDLAKDGW